jgi:2,3-dihydroxybenzoate-AMP ligase
VLPVLPNVAEFVILYFALQKIGAIPIAALVTHRYAEMSQFTQLSQARCCVYPEQSATSASARWSSACRPRTPACNCAWCWARPGRASIRCWT